MKEWVKEAPTLYKVLKAIAMPPQFSKRKMQSLRPIIGTAGAMLLKARNVQMSAVQYLVGLSLFLGRTRKKVCFKIFYMLHYCSCQKHHINPSSVQDIYYKEFKCTSGLMEQ